MSHFSTTYCLPQVTLHGFDEGLVLKLNYGVLELLIRVSFERDRMQATDVTPPTTSEPVISIIVTFSIAMSHFGTL